MNGKKKANAASDVKGKRTSSGKLGNNPNHKKDLRVRAPKKASTISASLRDTKDLTEVFRQLDEALRAEKRIEPLANKPNLSNPDLHFIVSSAHFHY